MPALKETQPCSGQLLGPLRGDSQETSQQISSSQLPPLICHVIAGQGKVGRDS